MESTSQANTSVEDLYGDIDDMYTSQSDSEPLGTSEDIFQSTSQVTMETTQDEAECGSSMNDLDLYDDLIVEEGQQRIETMQEIIKKYEEAMALKKQLESENRALRELVNKKDSATKDMQKNFSSLLITAKGELTRKDKELNNLRKRLSDSSGSYLRSRNSKLSRDRNNYTSAESDFDPPSTSSPSKQRVSKLQESGADEIRRTSDRKSRDTRYRHDSGSRETDRKNETNRTDRNKGTRQIEYNENPEKREDRGRRNESSKDAERLKDRHKRDSEYSKSPKKSEERTKSSETSKLKDRKESRDGTKSSDTSKLKDRRERGDGTKSSETRSKDRSESRDNKKCDRKESVKSVVSLRKETMEKDLNRETQERGVNIKEKQTVEEGELIETDKQSDRTSRHDTHNEMLEVVTKVGAKSEENNLGSKSKTLDLREKLRLKRLGAQLDDPRHTKGSNDDVSKPVKLSSNSSSDRNPSESVTKLKQSEDLSSRMESDSFSLFQPKANNTHRQFGDKEKQSSVADKDFLEKLKISIKKTDKVTTYNIQNVPSNSSTSKKQNTLLSNSGREIRSYTDVTHDETETDLDGTLASDYYSSTDNYFSATDVPNNDTPKTLTSNQTKWDEKEKMVTALSHEAEMHDLPNQSEHNGIRPKDEINVAVNMEADTIIADQHAELESESSKQSKEKNNDGNSDYPIEGIEETESSNSLRRSVRLLSKSDSSIIVSKSNEEEDKLRQAKSNTRMSTGMINIDNCKNESVFGDKIDSENSTRASRKKKKRVLRSVTSETISETTTVDSSESVTEMFSGVSEDLEETDESFVSAGNIKSSDDVSTSEKQPAFQKWVCSNKGCSIKMRHLHPKCSEMGSDDSESKKGNTEQVIYPKPGSEEINENKEGILETVIYPKPDSMKRSESTGFLVDKHEEMEVENLETNKSENMSENRNLNTGKQFQHTEKETRTQVIKDTVELVGKGNVRSDDDIFASGEESETNSSSSSCTSSSGSSSESESESSGEHMDGMNTTNEGKGAIVNIQNSQTNKHKQDSVMENQSEIIDTRPSSNLNKPTTDIIKESIIQQNPDKEGTKEQVTNLCNKNVNQTLNRDSCIDQAIEELNNGDKPSNNVDSSDKKDSLASHMNIDQNTTENSKPLGENSVNEVIPEEIGTTNRGKSEIEEETKAVEEGVQDKKSVDDSESDFSDSDDSYSGDSSYSSSDESGTGSSWESDSSDTDSDSSYNPKGNNVKHTKLDTNKRLPENVNSIEKNMKKNNNVAKDSNFKHGASTNTSEEKNLNKRTTSKSKQTDIPQCDRKDNVKITTGTEKRETDTGNTRQKDVQVTTDVPRTSKDKTVNQKVDSGKVVKDKDANVKHKSSNSLHSDRSNLLQNLLKCVQNEFKGKENLLMLDASETKEKGHSEKLPEVVPSKVDTEKSDICNKVNAIDQERKSVKENSCEQHMETTECLENDIEDMLTEPYSKEIYVEDNGLEGIANKSENIEKGKTVCQSTMKTNKNSNSFESGKSLEIQVKTDENRIIPKSAQAIKSVPLCDKENGGRQRSNEILEKTSLDCSLLSDTSDSDYSLSGSSSSHPTDCSTCSSGSESSTDSDSESERNVEKPKAESLEKPQTGIPEKTKAVIAETSKAGIPEKIQTVMPEKPKTGIPENSKAKIPEKTKVGILENAKAVSLSVRKSTEGNKLKSPSYCVQEQIEKNADTVNTVKMTIAECNVKTEIGKRNHRKEHSVNSIELTDKFEISLSDEVARPNSLENNPYWIADAEPVFLSETDSRSEEGKNSLSPNSEISKDLKSLTPAVKFVALNMSPTSKNASNGLGKIDSVVGSKILEKKVTKCIDSETPKVKDETKDNVSPKKSKAGVDKNSKQQKSVSKSKSSNQTTEKPEKKTYHKSEIKTEIARNEKGSCSSKSVSQEPKNSGQTCSNIVTINDTKSSKERSKRQESKPAQIPLRRSPRKKPSQTIVTDNKHVTKSSQKTEKTPTKVDDTRLKTTKSNVKSPKSDVNVKTSEMSKSSSKSASVTDKNNGNVTKATSDSSITAQEKKLPVVKKIFDPKKEPLNCKEKENLKKSVGRNEKSEIAKKSSTSTTASCQIKDKGARSRTDTLSTGKSSIIAKSFKDTTKVLTEKIMKLKVERTFLEKELTEKSKGDKDSQKLKIGSTKLEKSGSKSSIDVKENLKSNIDLVTSVHRLGKSKPLTVALASNGRDDLHFKMDKVGGLKDKDSLSVGERVTGIANQVSKSKSKDKLSEDLHSTVSSLKKFTIPKKCAGNKSSQGNDEERKTTCMSESLTKRNLKRNEEYNAGSIKIGDRKKSTCKIGENKTRNDKRDINKKRESQVDNAKRKYVISDSESSSESDSSASMEVEDTDALVKAVFGSSDSSGNSGKSLALDDLGKTRSSEDTDDIVKDKSPGLKRKSPVTKVKSSKGLDKKMNNAVSKEKSLGNCKVKTAVRTRKSTENVDARIEKQSSECKGIESKNRDKSLKGKCYQEIKRSESKSRKDIHKNSDNSKEGNKSNSTEIDTVRRKSPRIKEMLSPYKGSANTKDTSESKPSTVCQTVHKSGKSPFKSEKGFSSDKEVRHFEISEKNPFLNKIVSPKKPKQQVQSKPVKMDKDTQGNLKAETAAPGNQASKETKGVPILLLEENTMDGIDYHDDLAYDIDKHETEEVFEDHGDSEDETNEKQSDSNELTDSDRSIEDGEISSSDESQTQEVGNQNEKGTTQKLNEMTPKKKKTSSDKTDRFSPIHFPASPTRSSCDRETCNCVRTDCIHRRTDTSDRKHRKRYRSDSGSCSETTSGRNNRRLRRDQLPVRKRSRSGNRTDSPEYRRYGKSERIIDNRRRSVSPRRRSRRSRSNSRSRRQSRSVSPRRRKRSRSHSPLRSRPPTGRDHRTERMRYKYWDDDDDKRSARQRRRNRSCSSEASPSVKGGRRWKRDRDSKESSVEAKSDKPSRSRNKSAVFKKVTEDSSGVNDTDNVSVKPATNVSIVTDSSDDENERYCKHKSEKVEPLRGKKTIESSQSRNLSFRKDRSRRDIPDPSPRKRQPERSCSYNLKRKRRVSGSDFESDSERNTNNKNKDVLPNTPSKRSRTERNSKDSSYDKSKKRS